MGYFCNCTAVDPRRIVLVCRQKESAMLNWLLLMWRRFCACLMPGPAHGAHHDSGPEAYRPSNPCSALPLESARHRARGNCEEMLSNEAPGRINGGWVHTRSLEVDFGEEGIAEREGKRTVVSARNLRKTTYLVRF